MGNYRELLVYTAQLDPELQAHINSSKVFEGVSSHIQNDVISSIAYSLSEIIKDEVRIRGGVLEDVLEDTFSSPCLGLEASSPWPWPRSLRSSKIALSSAREQHYFLNH